jgi:hypothetical protein
MCVFQDLPDHKSSREQKYETNQQKAENGHHVLPVVHRDPHSWTPCYHQPMNREMLQQHLEQTEEHIATSEKLIVEQRALIE